MGALKGLLEKTNYVYLVEVFVILCIVVILLFVFHQLGLLKKDK